MNHGRVIVWVPRTRFGVCRSTRQRWFGEVTRREQNSFLGVSAHVVSRARARTPDHAEFGKGLGPRAVSCPEHRGL